MIRSGHGGEVGRAGKCSSPDPYHGSLFHYYWPLYSGHTSRQSLEVYSRLAIGEAQEEYDKAIRHVPV